MTKKSIAKIVCALAAAVVSLASCSSELTDPQNQEEKTVTLTFKADGGNWSGSTNDMTLTGKEGAELTALAIPAKTGYTFSAWNPAVPATFPAADTTYTATWNDVAPAAVASLTATTGSAQVTLHWTNPADSDFSKAVVEYDCVNASSQFGLKKVMSNLMPPAQTKFHAVVLFLQRLYNCGLSASPLSIQSGSW